MNGALFANALYTLHQGAASTRGLSPRVWGKARNQMLTPDGANAFMTGDDFTEFSGMIPAISGATAYPSVVSGDGRYLGYFDTGTTTSNALRLTGVTGGVCRLTTGATDNHLTILNSGDLGIISDTAADAKLTIFEARIRLATEVAAGSMFVGLATPTLCTADGGLIANAGGLIATGGGIGFMVKEDEPAEIDFVYQAASQAETVVIDTLQTAVADTWYKLGFVYDPLAPTSKRITCYLDNVEQSTYVTGTNIAAATFPDAEYLGAHMAAMSEGAAAKLVDIDWWQFYQAG
jgi:hypothetical protein